MQRFCWVYLIIIVVMASRGKKFLVIMEINNILFYLNTPKAPTSPNLQHIPIQYNDSYRDLSVSVRKGKAELLNHLFITMRQDLDIAVWSSLSNEFTNDLCHKHFTRYYRDLLFILATNRPLYGEHPPHTPLKVRKDLANIYSRFPDYNEGNTIVVTAEDNLIEAHSRNDLKIPEYSPTNPTFLQDPGLVPLAKYLNGLVLLKNESGINDIRRFISAKEASNIFKRASHNIFTDRTYI